MLVWLLSLLPALAASAVMSPATATSGRVLPMGGKLPPPLSPSDGVHTFTYDSVQRRLPLIIEAVISNNDFPESLVDQLRSFADEIAAGVPLKPLVNPSEEWKAQLEPLLANGETWFSAPWWISENYFYKRMLELTDGPTDMADPFTKQKADSLAGSAGAFTAACNAGLSETEELAPLVAGALWGNLADLSLSAGAALVAPEVASSGSALGSDNSMMLADDTAVVCEALLRCEGKQICIVLDNCGLELVSDLLLVDGLLRIVRPSRVLLHAKDRPVFVSDVMIKDVAPTIDWLEEQGKGGAGEALAQRLRASLADGRLAVEAPSYYTGSLPFWDLPEDVRSTYEASAIVVTKGDANYRRLLGDLHWPHDASFADVLSYFPTDLVSLRTCKSGVLVGVAPEVEAAAAAAHPEKWLVAGLYGVVQAKLGP